MEEIINHGNDVSALMRKYPDGHLPDLIITISDYRGLFQFCAELKTINSITFTKTLTDCYCMFSNCYKLETVPLFDTSNVTGMAYMFSECLSLKSIPLFNISNIKDMYCMFFKCYSLEEIPEFDVNPYIRMAHIIEDCYSLKKLPEFILLNELSK